jgi:hypothetical protein
MQSHKIEQVHFALTRTIVRMREEVEMIQRFDVDAETKQSLINRAYEQIEALERTRSEVMDILWA